MQTLKPDDYVAIIAYDLRTEILSDFTNDRGKIQEALSRLRIPGFSESNMFDALTDTADRMSKIEGRKAILLIASGIDTFSKLTYDKARKSPAGIRRAGLFHRYSASGAHHGGSTGFDARDSNGFPAGR